MRKFLKIILVVFIVLLCFSLVSCSNKDKNNDTSSNEDISNVDTNTETGFKVVWKNWDDSILETDKNVEYGTTPTYNGQIPTKPEDDEYTYTFSGWSPAVSSVVENTIYKAEFISTRKSIRINFNLNGGITNHSADTKEISILSADDFFFDLTKNNYVFKGWSYKGEKVFDQSGNLINNVDLEPNMIFDAIFVDTINVTIKYILINSQDNSVIGTYDRLDSKMGNGTITKDYPFNSNVDISIRLNEGFLFNGWYYDVYEKNSLDQHYTDYLLSIQNNYRCKVWDQDIVINGIISVNSYSLLVKANNSSSGTVSIDDSSYSGQLSYSRYYTKTVTIAAKSIKEYRFLGWYDEDGNLVTTNQVYSFTMPNYDYSLEARWNKFTIKYNLNGGQNNSNNPNEYDLETDRNLLNPTREDYVFDGWYLENKNIKITSLNGSWQENITITALWKGYYHFKTTSNNDSAGTYTYADSVYYSDQSITITVDSVNSGYRFLGWYDGNNCLTTSYSYSFNMPCYDITYTAKFNVDSNSYYQLRARSNNTVRGTVTPSSMQSVGAGQYYTFTATTKPGFTFTGWYDYYSGDFISKNLQYTLKMPNENVYYEARWCKVETTQEDDDYGDITTLDGKYVSGNRISISASPKNGYTFVGWYNCEILLTNDPTYSFYIPSEDVTYEARWTYYTLTTTQNNSNAGEIITEYTDEKITAGSTIELSATTNDGYTWVGWYKDGILANENLTFSFVMPRTNVNYEARWTYYTLTTTKSISDAGTITTYDEEKITAGDNITLTAETNPGYTWLGWYKNNEKVDDHLELSFAMPKENVTYEARWTYYTVTITKNNNAAGIVPEPEKVTAGIEHTIQVTQTNSGYTWEGWYKNNQRVSIETSYTFTMPSEDVTYEARWTYFTVTTINNNANAGTITTYNNTAITVGENVTLQAVPNRGYSFDGWYKNNQRVSTDTSYTFQMINEDVEYVAKWVVAYTRSGSTIYYGLYPQSVVTEDDINFELTSRAGTLPNSTNNNQWNNYGYYIYGSQSNCMWYKDLNYSGEKYRGVYIVNYRPSFTSITGGVANTKQDDNGYYIETIYWFKWEPIKWNILSEPDSEKMLIIADLLLDSQDYYYNSATDSHNHNGGTGYSNNYQLSAIRMWLNDYFYETAFDVGQQSIMIKTDVDNSANSTGIVSNSYACENTEDKIFLLSYEEATNYYTNDDDRIAYGSDYAKAQGLAEETNEASRWWLRSPINSASSARTVDNVGSASGSNNVYKTSVGVRPAIWIYII